MNESFRLHAISDNPETLTGLALGGIAGQPATTPKELLQALENIPPDVGIVIITSTLAAESADILEKHRSKNRLPMIVIIPEGATKV